MLLENRLAIVTEEKTNLKPLDKIRGGVSFVLYFSNN